MFRGKPRLLIASPAKRYNSSPAKRENRFVQPTCFLKDTPSAIAKHFDANEPACFKRMFTGIPAYEKWFTEPVASEELVEQDLPRFISAKARKPENSAMDAFTKAQASRKLNMEYLQQFGVAIVPLELTKTDEAGKTTFERFEGPFSLLLEYVTGEETSKSRLYLAQRSLADLPQALQDDLPTPEILKQFGKGDIYASSLWMGRAPTRTPLHRDPNPNLFVQLAGRKIVRMMGPHVGREMYERARAGLGGSQGLANMRGEEMMQGKELEALESAVWDNKTENMGDTTVGIEVELKKGDGLYIPLGWWHAVRGTGKGPNVSVSRQYTLEEDVLTSACRSIGGSAE
jgi:hypothetical protein